MPDVNRNNAPGFDPRLFLRDEELDYGISLLLAAERVLMSRASEIATDYHIPHLAVRILIALRFDPGPSVKQLREHLGATTPTLARILADLSERGWIERRVGRSDRRSKSLFLTVEGKRVTDPATLAMRRALQMAYRKAGATAVSSTRTILEGLE